MPQANQQGMVYVAEFTSWEKTIPPLLTLAGLDKHLANQDLPILIKPNLVEALAPPITTPVGLVAALVQYLRTITDAPILIGEGCGSIAYETGHAYDKLGYTAMAEELRVELIDLNHADLVRLSSKRCRRWPEIHLPRIVFACFLLSVPVLKAHSLAGVTLTMKNMMGLAPPSHYQQGGSWKKSAFHSGIQEAIADLNRYRAPDFTLLDASVGMPEAHLWGPACDPPVNRLAAAYDPVAMDAHGAGLLKKKWQDIKHINLVNNELGRAAPLTIVNA
ncbi:MAG: DUF362 domain-containing protein [Desulfobulbaceae bacterium]|nr:DUF362 domain-containing protein [Desulfobulbaceae bacterium]